MKKLYVLLLAVMLLGGSLLAGASAPVHAQERDDVPAKSAHAVRSAQKTTAPPTLPRVFGEQRVDEAAFRRAADKAYQAHHGMCPQCRAAGLNPGGQQRCTEGAGLWAAYQEAGDPPHFMFLGNLERGK